MDKIQATAVTKAMAKVKGSIPVGTHDVDVTVRVRGTVTKGEDYETPATVAVPLKATLALVLQYAGVTREAAVATITQAMTKALELEQRGAQTVETIALMADIDDTMKQVVAALGELPKITASGKTTAKVEIVEA